MLAAKSRNSARPDELGTKKAHRNVLPPMMAVELAANKSSPLLMAPRTRPRSSKFRRTGGDKVMYLALYQGLSKEKSKLLFRPVQSSTMSNLLQAPVTDLDYSEQEFN